MSPILHIKPKHRQPGWLSLDLRDDEDIEAVVVIPTFGPDHHAGMDCWCCPSMDADLIVHNEQN